MYGPEGSGEGEREREEIIRAMQEEYSLSDLFLKFLLARRLRTKADLVNCVGDCRSPRP